jgi:hypothetical protein
MYREDAPDPQDFEPGREARQAADRLADEELGRDLDSICEIDDERPQEVVEVDVAAEPRRRHPHAAPAPGEPYDELVEFFKNASSKTGPLFLRWAVKHRERSADASRRLFAARAVYKARKKEERRIALREAYLLRRAAEGRPVRDYQCLAGMTDEERRERKRRQSAERQKKRRQALKDAQQVITPR